MAYTESIYKGSGFGFGPTYGINENYGESFLGFDYRTPTSHFGFPTDPTTANQLQSVSNKISTGTKTIEVSGLSITGGGAMSMMDKIPKQHWKEIERLKKLTGVDLTFHGPLVEPTGIKRNWQEHDREQVERQMISAIERSHELDPKGNLIVTFHSSNRLPEPEVITINDKGEKEVREFWVVDENINDFQNLALQYNYFKNEKTPPEKIIETMNEESWFRELQHINFNVHQGADIIEKALTPQSEDSPDIKKIKQEGIILDYYKKVGTEEAQEELKKLGPYAQLVENKMTELIHGDIYLREAYGEFQNLYNRAYKAAEINDSIEDKNKLNKFREELTLKLKDIEKDSSKVRLLANELVKGINVMRTINPPQTIKPLKEWAIDKASTTFSNVALEAYKKFKDEAPIISIENPPAGSGLSRAEDLRELVDAARDKFIEEAVKNPKLGLSKTQAKEQAEKLIGVTWDIGHINMLRGHGYGEEHIVEQTRKIAPYVKHVHLSDNFGLEHTELPMGMGNVPTKKMLDLIHGFNKQVKKIAETGDWFSGQGGLAQKQTPIRQTLQAFGSSVYETGMPPYWNQGANLSGGYFVGQGATNPEIHHQLFGSGFSNLPVELGGQMAGRSRASGAPIE